MIPKSRELYPCLKEISITDRDIKGWRALPPQLGLRSLELLLRR